MHHYGTLLIMEVMIWVSGNLAMSYRLLHHRRAVLDILVDDNGWRMTQVGPTLTGHEAGVPLYHRPGGLVMSSQAS